MADADTQNIAETEILRKWPGTRITLSPGLTRNNQPTIVITPAPALITNIDTEPKTTDELDEITAANAALFEDQRLT